MATDPKTLNKILGAGLVAPFEFTDTPVGLGPVSKVGFDIINSSIYNILGTRKGERVNEPEFGSDLWTLLFEPLNILWKDRAVFYIVDAIARWEKRIKVVQVGFNDSQFVDGQGIVNINISYEVIGTPVVGSFVYPFFRPSTSVI